MNTYKYTGPVWVNSIKRYTEWEASTTAASLGKAESNLTYRFKKSNGLNMRTYVDLSRESNYWKII